MPNGPCDIKKIKNGQSPGHGDLLFTLILTEVIRLFQDHDNRLIFIFQIASFCHSIFFQAWILVPFLFNFDRWRCTIRVICEHKNRDRQEAEPCLNFRFLTVVFRLTLSKFNGNGTGSPRL